MLNFARCAKSNSVLNRSVSATIHHAKEVTRHSQEGLRPKASHERDARVLTAIAGISLAQRTGFERRIYLRSPSCRWRLSDDQAATRQVGASRMGPCGGPLCFI